MLHKKICKST